jgi:hypothetical protein
VTRRRAARPRHRRVGPVATLAALIALAAAGCTAPAGPTGPGRYRLAHSGEGWTGSSEDAVLDDLRPRYPTLFRQVFDPSMRGDFDLRAVRRDLEHAPVDRRNFDALNAVAIAYFEVNHRAQINPGGPGYFDDSFRAAKLLAVPWRAYGEVADPALRDAIVDFFEDAASGEKLETAGTAARLGPIVASLEAKEDDPKRRVRIRALARRLQATSP